MNHLNLLSKIISVIGIITILIVNYQLGNQYHLSDGKTQAFYDFIVLGRQTELLWFGGLAFFISIAAFINKEPRKKAAISLILSLVTTCFSFIDFWKLWN